ncbi:MAG: hypothetical protein WCK67_08605 [bacterium]
MLIFDPYNKPSNWESDEEWSNFFWKNNVLGLYKIISDCLLAQFPKGYMSSFTEKGLHYKSEESIALMRYFENNNLLLLKKFTFSLWVVINSEIENYFEKVEIKLNDNSFVLKYEDSEGKFEELFIPRIIETYEEMRRNNSEINNLIDKLLETDKQIKQYERNFNYNISSQAIEYYKKEIAAGNEKIKKINNDIRLCEIELQERIKKLNLLHELELDLAKWGVIFKRILKTKLFDLSLLTKKTKQSFIHVIEVEFYGNENANKLIPSLRMD